MPLLAALLLAGLSLPVLALPPFDPFSPQGSWEKVSRADAGDMTGALCPSTAFGVVEKVRLRSAPVPVFCLEPNGTSIRLRPSGFELGPGAPKLLVKDFSRDLSFPARLEPFAGPVDAASLADCADRHAPALSASDRGCRRLVNARRIGEALRAAARIGDTQSALFAQAVSEQEDGQAEMRKVEAGFGMDSVLLNNHFMVFFGEDDDILAYVIGHEFGHFWQKSRGADYREKTDLARQRAVEAECDSYSWRILRDAGYPVERAMAGQRRFFTALGDRGGFTHPLHIHRLAAAAVDALTPDRPQGAGPRPPEPRLRQGMMDREGRPIPLPAALPALDVFAP